MSAATTVEAPGDAELISAVRGGDVDAYGTLFERHVDAARRLARQLVPAGDAEDLVSDAFVKVLGVLQRGGGPDVAFRAYLLTSVRRLQVDRFRATSRLHSTDDMEPFDPGVPFVDTAVEGFESAAAAKAFASLPERWQLVLWHTEVEGDKPADIAPLLGMSANSVSALAYRAREGLRQAFLTQHAADVEADTCRWTHGQLGAYIRGSSSRRDAAKVEDHLHECRACMAIYLELTEVNSNLGAILAPLLLGGVATAYVSATAAAGAAPVGLGVVLGRVRDLVTGNAGTAAVAGVATCTVMVAGGIAIGLGGPDRVPADPAALRPSVPSASSSQAGAPAPSRSPGAVTSTRPRTAPSVVTLAPGDEVEITTYPPAVPPTLTTLPADPAAPPGTQPTADPSTTTTQDPTPTSEPTPTASPTPTSAPTSAPTSVPTSAPTSEPTPTSVPTTSSPTASPTSEPTSTPPPTGEPTSTPTATPTPTPTPTPDPTPRSDPGLDGSVSVDRPTYTYTVVLRVTGLPDGALAMLELLAPDASVVRTEDARCQVVRLAASCNLTGSEVAPVSFEVVAPSTTAVEALLTPIAPDLNPDNNSWRARLD